MAKPHSVIVGNKGLHEKKGPLETAVKQCEVPSGAFWNIRDADPYNRRLKSMLGDAGATRTNPKSIHGYKTTVGRNKAGATTSIFPPRVAINILRLFCPPDSKVFDPFAGGGCRAVFAAMAGHHYTGVEIRKEEVESINAMCKKHGVDDQVNIIHGDARKKNGLPSGKFDFCYTCPPYWNLEQYKGDPGDLSMMDYDKFLEAVYEIILNCHRVLKPGALACWVVGLHRMPKTMDLVHIPGDIAQLHCKAGFRYEEEIIIYRNNPVALKRVGNFECGHKLLIRAHEYCLVFKR